MENFDFNYNFQHLNLIRLHQEHGIIPQELISVFENKRTKCRDLIDFPLQDGYRIMIGYSNKKRMLLIAFNTINYQINFLQVKIADEDELVQYYCQA